MLWLLGDAAGYGNQAVAVPGLGNLHDLLTAYHCGGLCDCYGVVFKVHVVPGQSQDFALAQAGIDGQREQNFQLCGKLFGAGVVAYGVLLACVIRPGVTLCVDGVGLAYVVQEGGGLLRGEEFYFFCAILCLDPDGITGVSLYVEPLSASPERLGGAQGAFLGFKGLHLGSTEKRKNPLAGLSGGVIHGSLIQGLALMDDFIAQLFPAAPGVGLLGDLGGGLGGILGFGVGPGKPQGQGERRNALAEELPCGPHNAVQIVLFHAVAS